jgi:LEA14-like dessication related protein
MPDSNGIRSMWPPGPIASFRSTSAILVLAAVVSFGCSTTETVTPPEVTLVDLDFVDATIFESTLDVGVRIFNENPEPLVLDGAVIKLELEGRSFGKGAFSERIEIPKLDSVVQLIEMHLSHIAVATKLKTVVESQVVNYSITGKVYVITPSGRVSRLPIDKRGRIDLRGQGPRDLPKDATAGVVDGE